LNVTQYQPLYPDSALFTFITNPTGREYWANNYVTQAPNSPLVVDTWTIYTTSSSSIHFRGLYKVQITIQDSRAFYYFDYAGFAWP
jgi:hypothetical protein